MADDGPVVLVTGGAGFLGHALIHELLRPDDPVLRPAEVRSFDVRPAPLRQGVTAITGDVRDPAALRAACDGVDLVIHAASMVDWGLVDAATLRAVNVDGTRNVVDACRAAGVRALVHTSSLDAIDDGQPLLDGDETLPYPPRFPNVYSETKATSEQLVLAADDPDGLRTAVIRPCGLYGERDPYHLGQVLRMAAAMPLVRIGNGRARAQHVYVGNTAHGHLVAARSLLQDQVAAGRVYFVTDHPAENFFDFLEPVVTGVGHRVRPWSQAIPFPVAWVLGALTEGLAWAVRPVVTWRPGLSRYGVTWVCKDCTFSSDRIRLELGYAPRYSHAEGLERTIAWFREHPVG